MILAWFMPHGRTVTRDIFEPMEEFKSDIPCFQCGLIKINLTTSLRFARDIKTGSEKRNSLKEKMKIVRLGFSAMVLGKN